MEGHGTISFEEFQAIRAAVAMAKASPTQQQLLKALPQLEPLYKADVSNILQGQEFTDAFTPLVTQAIDTQWTSETFQDKDLVLQKLLKEKAVGSPLYEVATVTQFGDDGIPAAFAEGGTTEQEESEINRKIARIKYLGVQRSITDVAAVTDILGRGQVSKSGLDFQTSAAVQSLSRKYERSLFDGDTAMSPLEFDGIRKQIVAGGNVVDADGGKLQLADFVSGIFELADDPYYGHVDTILMPTTLIGNLLGLFSQSSARLQTMDLGPGTMLTFNAGRLSIVGPTGEAIPLMPTPMIRHAQTPKATASGKAPTVVAGGDITLTSPNAGGDTNFKAADLGDYYYKIVAVGDKGSAAPITKGPVTVASGDRVFIDIEDSDAPTSGDYSVRFYEVYRSAKDGDASTCKYIGRFARNLLGTGGDSTGFYDENRSIPGTSDVYALETNPDSLYVANLLPVIRRPLAEVATSKPFMTMLFKAPHVRAPRKHKVWTNVSLTL
jgi:hypothetical protein